MKIQVPALLRPRADSRRAVQAILLATLISPPASMAQVTNSTPAVVAMIGNEPISSTKLDELVGNELLRLRTEGYQVQRRILDGYIAEELLRREAAARKIAFKELIRAEIEAKVRTVTPEEARAVYDTGTGPFANLSEPEALSQITASMRQQRLRRRRAEFVRELRANANVRVLLEPPRLNVDASTGYSKGPADAPVTIVEFTDFECPYCARLNPTLARVRERYGDRVRLVFRDFPLSSHSNAQEAAEAAACAGEQGKFWEMHDLLFANSQHLQRSDLRKYAVKAGVGEVEAFERCLDSGQYVAAINKAQSEGARYGVGGTPTLFINGRMLSGVLPYDTLAEVIDEELGRVQGTRKGGSP